MPIDLNGALAHHRQGDLERAVSTYLAALKENPNRAEALHLLGIAELQRGNASQAAELISRAIAINPDSASYHASIAEAFWALKQPKQAAEHGRIALRLKPDDPEALCNLGATLLELGDLDTAIQCFRDALRLRPQFFAAHNNLGNALELRGEKIAALAHYREAAKLNPIAEVHSNLGKLLLELGQPREALIHCREAVRLQPQFPAALVNLGNVLQSQGRIEEAAASFREAIRIEPRLTAAHAALGGVLEQLGDLDLAIVALREALRHDPRHAGALSRLATRLRDQLPETDRLAIESRLADPHLPKEHRWSLQFGLAHALDAQGQHQQAAVLTTEANALQGASFRRRGRTYDPHAHRVSVDHLIAAFGSKHFDRVRGFGSKTDRPVFIVGMPRSGTTLVEQILASHPRIFGAGEQRLAQEAWGALRKTFESQSNVTPLTFLERLDRRIVQQLAADYLKRLESLGGSADRIVDKMPENTLYLGWITTLFPNAKLIHCRRDPRDIALSCWMTHFERVRWACDPDFIVSRIQEHQRLMSHWRQALPTLILDMDYEAIVDNLEVEARKLIDWCGLEWDPRCLEFHKTRRLVLTASAAQVRQPIYRKSLGRWKHYEKTLPRLFSPWI